MGHPRRRRRTGPWLAAVLALVALALGAYVWLRRPPLITLPVPPSSAPGPEPTPPPTVPPPAVTEPLAAPPGTAPDTPEERGLPPLAESDTLVRELASGLTSHPGLSVWLSTDGLIQRFVAAVDNIAGGESPRPHLLFLAPAAKFRVVRRKGRLYVDPKSYERYDLVADVLASLDPPRTVEVYRRLQPLCEDAYRGLGKPQGRFDDVLVKAIRTLLATPVVEGDVELTPKVITYAFADPALEGLSPAQKHLLRMGPKNERAIQAELRALATALGMG